MSKRQRETERESKERERNGDNESKKYKNDHLLCFFLTGNGGGWSNSSLPK